MAASRQYPSVLVPDQRASQAPKTRAEAGAQVTGSCTAHDPKQAPSLCTRRGSARPPLLCTARGKRMVWSSPPHFPCLKGMLKSRIQVCSSAPVLVSLCHKSNAFPPSSHNVPKYHASSRVCSPMLKTHRQAPKTTHVDPQTPTPPSWQALGAHSGVTMPAMRAAPPCRDVLAVAPKRLHGRPTIPTSAHQSSTRRRRRAATR